MATNLDLPSNLPIDILHVSDLHFPAHAPGKRFRGHFDALLNHVSEVISHGRFRPELIAFTGDLVDTPFPRGRKAFRRGAQALLDLAHRCGFVTKRVEVGTGPQLPDAWKELLYRRIFTVPGNHDLYFSGLRLLWNRFTTQWLELAAPTPEWRDKLHGHLVPPKVQTGPLSISLLDSNGPARGWASARGEAQQPLGITKTPKQSFGVALLHGHPIQLPFLLEGLTEAEPSLLLENAGLLLKNLVAANIRLVLHGHRHYPGVGTMVLPPPQDTSALQGKVGLPIVVVGAGSITDPPEKLGYSSYNWIRIHPDFRVEVREAQKHIGDNHFVLQPTYLAEPGDFQYDHVEKKIEIKPSTGDVDVTIKVSGLRTTPGRQPITRLPFGVQHDGASRLAAYRVEEILGGAPGTRLAWNFAKQVLSVDPPHASTAPPLHFSIRYFLHNAMALNDWEAFQMWGRRDSSDDTTHQPTCSTARLGLIAKFPHEIAQSFQNHSAESCWCEMVLPSGKSQPTDYRVDTNLNEDTKSNTLTATASVDLREPQSHKAYRMRWRLPSLTPRPESARKALEAIRRWQIFLLEKHHQGQTSLDDACRQISRRLVQQYESEVFTSLWIGKLAENEGTRFELCLVGSSHPLSGSLARYNLPFGAGVVGRAFRLGMMVDYDKHEAEASRDRYQHGTRGAVPKNFLRPVGNQENYQNLLAIPILASTSKLPEIKRPEGRNVLVTLCLGPSHYNHNLPDWKGEDLKWLTTHVTLPLEEDIYYWAQQLGRQER